MTPIEKGVSSSRDGRFWPFGERHCDLLDVLGTRGQQALPFDLDEATEPGIAMSMQLLGIGKGTLHRLLASFVDGLAPRREAVGVGALAGIGPHMARVMVRSAPALLVQEARSGQSPQMAGSER